MSKVRAADGKAQASRYAIPSRTVFLIEDSAALGLLLLHKIGEQTNVDVRWFKSYADAEAALIEQRPALAVTGLNLPDAPDGEIVDLLAEGDIPTILFTATLNRRARDRFSTPNIIDYFLKDAAATVDAIVQTIIRYTETISPSVLVVDDMASGRAVLVDLLRRQNYRTFEASSGAEALAMLAAHQDIELVITDYHMADMDGHELTKTVRARYAPDRIRVIGISASSDPFLSASFLKAGASDFVYRPFIAEEVKYRIQSNLETLDQIKHLRFLAERDPLTGLYNRRAFFEKAHHILDELSARDGEEGSVAILDIDHFKKVNDNYGHDTGDKVIKLVAGVLEDSCQQGNAITARFGGEEFVVLFTNLTIDEVQERCEAIRIAVSNLVIPYENRTLNVTASLGAAIMQASEGMDNNLNAADQMLYMAKNGGRNRVVYDAIFCRA
ncbi:diguanylate cyclase [Sphingobium sufflavum]|uniref:diguanylate cyclase n=1 Tax=Sphingobium sufflavum TaxID=1129547 RepID=UPI001F4219CF|nr:diguanylate cyclase [Sphingobium sufflavum]MCE7797219.1 diguanylate cyclase [Sphingobium sufflavum]